MLTMAVNLARVTAMPAPVVVLAGGTGGAKLARGMLDVAGEDLVVIANTGDDVEIHGGHVSPDPDLVTFWLADRVDDRGWGLRDDTFAVMEALRALGEDVWFHLGDRDLAVCLARARRLADGATLTAAADDLRRALGVPARVLPMSDEPVRTRIKARGEWSGLQEWLIRERAAAPVEDVEFHGAEEAEPTAQVLEALSSARAVIVGPSNPVISVGPILAVPGLRDALRGCPGPVIAVSPLVGGRSLKGPTEALLEWAGQPRSSDGIAAIYEGLLDGLVADERTDALPTLETDVAMPDADGRRRVAQEALDFALALA
jgi:LPPG:FO 2-phospho-L-lactate transferase